MRVKKMAAFVVTILAFGLAAPKPAEAFGFNLFEPLGWGQKRVVRHYYYYPRYAHRFHAHSATDPYAYKYEQPGYYPLKDSEYWRPAKEVHKRRARHQFPRYHKAWGKCPQGRGNCAVKHHRHHR